MKRLVYTVFSLLMFIAVSAQTNDFYDDAPTMNLTTSQIMVGGEIANGGIVDLAKLPLRSVIVKETRLVGDKDEFIGSYRYDGYSIYDILNSVQLQKKNEKDFPPIIDLYVEIENDKGEKTVLSWGEIYYPIHRHEIIIATQVMRIVPSKTKELWPLPEQSKLVVASDLLTERNISNPVKITVKSYPKSFVINKGMSPMFAESVTINKEGEKINSFAKYPEGFTPYNYPAIFYGRGMGIHGTTPFAGFALKQYLLNYFPINKSNLTGSIFTFVGKDGYRGVFTYSEIMNRNDQAELLLLNKESEKDGGAYMLYPAADFFSDRAIKSLQEIHFDQIKDL